jgi:gluconate 2-dehydrogenase gamma chain
MEKITRRQLLLRTALTGSASLLASLIDGKAAVAQTNPLLPDSPGPQRFSYFTEAEITFLNAALAQLIPADALGPGAREAGGAYFIDQQMASPFGRAERWYMQGPWKEGTEEQGYQLKLSPAQLYRVGIRAVDGYCRSQFSGKTFAQLAPADQDKVLHGLEGGDIHLTDAPAKDFFDMLWQNTQESFFADPMYGGNRNFTGWKLIGFPGPRYNYVEEIGQYGKPYKQPTVGLSGRAGAIRKG